MKKIGILILLVSFIAHPTFGQSKKELKAAKKQQEYANAKELINSKQYIFTGEWATSSKGKRIIGWDEILEGGLSPNAAVMSWRGEQGGIEAAQLKHPVVMTPTTYCYFDYYQSSHPSEPLAIGGFLPLNKVYQFNPIPKELSQEFHQYILGGQANLWTEYIIDFDQLMYMTYPRALALSQSVWSMNKPEYEVFETNYLDFHEAFLTKLKSETILLKISPNL